MENQLDLFLYTIEIEGVEYQRLSLLDHNCDHSFKYVNDARCKGYKSGVNLPYYYEKKKERDLALKNTLDITEEINIRVGGLNLYSYRIIEKNGLYRKYTEKHKKV